MTSTFILCLMILHLAPSAVSLCCPSLSASCPLSVPAALTQCCSYGKCNAFCCDCEAECRVSGCNYALAESSYTVEVDPKTIISDLRDCRSADGAACTRSFPVVRAFHESDPASLPAPVLQLIAAELDKKDTVAGVTTTNLRIPCDVASGDQAWISQNPEFAVLSGVYVYQCCQGNGTCRVESRKEFRFRKPRVDSNGFNVGSWACESVDESDFAGRRAGFDSWTALLVLFFAALCVVLLFRDFRKVEDRHRGYFVI